MNLDVDTGEEEDDAEFVFEEDDDESEEGSEEEDEASAPTEYSKYKQKQENYAMKNLAKILVAYGVLDEKKLKPSAKLTYEDLDAAVKELHRRVVTLPDEADGKLKKCVFGAVRKSTCVRCGAPEF